MNITPFEVYLIMQADAFVEFLLILIVVCLISAAYKSALMMSGQDSEEENIATWKNINYTFLVVLVISVLALAIPSTKELVAMYVIPKLAQSTVATNLPHELQVYIDSLTKNDN